MPERCHEPISPVSAPRGQTFGDGLVYPFQGREFGGHGKQPPPNWTTAARLIAKKFSGKDVSPCDVVGGLTVLFAMGSFRCDPETVL
jgi:hypothetical protein